MSSFARVLGSVAVVTLALPALSGPAHAQGHGFHGAPGAPHMAAPAAPHFSAPAAAPHFSAPAAPHFAAPQASGPRFAAPHIAAAPHFGGAPHFAGPRFASPRFAPHVNAAPRFAHPGRMAPNFNASRFAGRQVAAPRFAAHNRFGAGHAGVTHAVPHFAGRQVGPHGPGRFAQGTHQLAPLSSAHTAPHGMPSTIGQGAAAQHAAGPHAVANEHNLQRTQPVLRNPVFAAHTPRAGAPTTLASTTFRGAFAQSQWAHGWQGGDRYRHHHHRFGFVLGFVGPLFWPYAYDDFIDYTFWPYAYDTFWPYAYDDLYAGIYGGYGPEVYAPDEAYAYAGAPATSYVRGGRAVRARAEAPGNDLRVCTAQVDQLVGFPIDRIREQVAPNDEQAKLLDELKNATAQAVDVLQAACPGELPSTPPGRLAAMRERVAAMVKAVQIVRGPLDAFYQSLSDEQKERFNALDQGGEAAGQRDAGLTRLCTGQDDFGAKFPVERIQRTLRLSDAQDADLDALSQASAKARELLKASCQVDQNLTPTGRLAAIEDRLNGVLQAIDTVQPQLAKFYDSLSDEQKAHFNRLSRPA